MRKLSKLGVAVSLMCIGGGVVISYIVLSPITTTYEEGIARLNLALMFGSPGLIVGILLLHHTIVGARREL